MATYVALLRGINVSGQKLIKMADLQSHFVSCGAENVRTYVQSGDVVFEHCLATPATLRKTLENHLAQRLGYSVPTLVKSVNEFAAIAKENPHDVSLPEFGKRMYVCFFEKAPAPTAIASIEQHVNKAERLVVKGAAAYAYYANGLGRAKLTSAIIERKLGLATMRNWNTVTALLGMAHD